MSGENVVKKRGRKPKMNVDLSENSTLLSQDPNIIKSSSDGDNSNINSDNPNNNANKYVLKKQFDYIEKIENIEEVDEFDELMNYERKKRGRKPKDKFKFDKHEEEISKNYNDDNINVKLPLTCLQLVSTNNIMSHNLFSYNPKLTIPEPFTKLTNNYTNLDSIQYNNQSNNQIGIIKNNNKTDKILKNDELEQFHINRAEMLLNMNANIHANVYLQNQSTTINIQNNSDIYQFNEESQHKQNYKDIQLFQQIFNKNKVQNNNTNNDNNNNMLDIDNKQRQIDIILNNKYGCNVDKIQVLTKLCHLTGNYNDINCNLKNNNTNNINNTNNTHENNWPESISTACFRCCHTFENTPWGIPHKYINGKFYLYGIFCSPNCALGYLLDSGSGNDNIWENISLLHLLYYEVYGKYINIMPSPDKICLKMFGGTLDIDKYRSITVDNIKSYTVEFPPCNTIIPMLEEIYKKNNLFSSFLPIENKNNKQLINPSVNHNFKLKRFTPVNNNRFTLDQVLVNK